MRQSPVHRLVLVAVLASACRDVSSPPIAASIKLSRSRIDFDALGDSVAITVEVMDQHGVPINGMNVTWAVADTIVRLSHILGTDRRASATEIISVLNGTTTITASVGGLSGVIAVTTRQVPATLEKLGGDSQVGATNTPLPLLIVARVRDRLGAPIANQSVTFSPSGGGRISQSQALSSKDGLALAGLWQLGPATGRQTLTASAGNAPEAIFEATVLPGPISTPASITVLHGGNQAAMAGEPPPLVPSVIVRDADANPLPGVSVLFAVAAGGGAVDGQRSTTDANGVASPTSWTLGVSATLNVLTASVTGVGSVDFIAAGCEGGGRLGYDITLCFQTPMTQVQRTVFVNAASRWQAIVVSELPDQQVDISARSCSSDSPAVKMRVDDLLIFVSLDPIDGSGGVLGAANWCYRRSAGLPIIGSMRFDSVDVAALEGSDRLQLVVLHEMGHVLGIGTLWSSEGLLHNASFADSALDTYFDGASATAAFDDAGGTNYMGGMKVPVENLGGGGTANRHWREGVFADELMTGFLNAGSNPLSAVTVRSLEDLGYIVDRSHAEPFTISLAGSSATGSRQQGLFLQADVSDGQRWAISRNGAITRIR